MEDSGCIYAQCQLDAHGMTGEPPIICEDEGRESDDNIGRAVACVNACAGINPEAVPELLAALEEFMGQVDDGGRGLCCGCNFEKAHELGIAAIAKAKPGE